MVAACAADGQTSNCADPRRRRRRRQQHHGQKLCHLCRHCRRQTIACQRRLRHRLWHLRERRRSWRPYQHDPPSSTYAETQDGVAPGNQVLAVLSLSMLCVLARWVFVRRSHAGPFQQLVQLQKGEATLKVMPAVRDQARVTGRQRVPYARKEIHQRGSSTGSSVNGFERPGRYRRWQRAEAACTGQTGARL